jgi:arginine repressor
MAVSGVRAVFPFMISLIVFKGRPVLSESSTCDKLPTEMEPYATKGLLAPLIQEISSNGCIIVIRTAVDSASLIARHLDQVNPPGILGTIAGDDTIFVVPAKTRASEIRRTIQAIRHCLGMDK